MSQASSSSSSKQRCLDLLREAASQRKIDPELVEGALVALEKEQLLEDVVRGGRCNMSNVVFSFKMLETYLSQTTHTRRTVRLSGTRNM